MERERAVRLARPLIAALLVALAYWRCGPPTATTAIWIAAGGALACAARAIATRGKGGFAPLREASTLTAVALAAAVAAWRFDGADGALQWAWWLLVGVPLALQSAMSEATVVPRPPAVAAACYVALALGLLDAEPWNDRVGRLLLFAIALVGVTGAALESARRSVPQGAPAASAAAWRRATATVVVIALLTLLLAVLVELLLAPLARLKKENAPPPRKDALTSRLAPPALDPDRSIALVRVISSGAGKNVVPPRLHLRETVFDTVVDSDGLLSLSRRIGAPTFVRDGDDGVVDGRIAVVEGGGGDPLAGVLQVTLLGVQQKSLLQVDRASWIEGDSLLRDADSSYERPARSGETCTYRVGATPSLAFAPPAFSSASTREVAARALPEGFRGRETLVKLVADATADATAVGTANASDDWQRAVAVVEALKRGGRLDPGAPFHGWTDFATWRIGSPLHFAQCAALLLRLARLPARVVSGYACDRYDAVEKHFELRGGDECWWVEVAFEESGWVALDPVPAPSLENDPAQAARQRAADAAQQRDQLEQRSLKNTFVTQRPLIAGILLALLVAAVFAFPSFRMRVAKLLLRRGPAGVGGGARRAWRFWQELLDRCRRHGLIAHPSWTAAEFASLVAQALPSLRTSVSELLRLYHAGRFGGVLLLPEEETRVRAILSRELPPALEVFERARAMAPPAGVAVERPRNRR